MNNNTSTIPEKNDELFQAETLSQASSSDNPIPPESNENDPKNKSTAINQGKILGLPTPLFFIIIGFICVGLVILIIAIASGSSKKNPKHDQSLSKQNEIQLSAEISALQSKISTTLSVAERATHEVANLRSDVEKRFAASDTNLFDHRISEVEKNIDEIKISINTLKRQVANNRPLSDNMVINPSATIISIGSGIARVRDEFGEEFSLQKGDKWDGNIVMSIRTDLRKVILSNGSIIQ